MHYVYLDIFGLVKVWKSMPSVFFCRRQISTQRKLTSKQTIIAVVQWRSRNNILRHAGPHASVLKAKPVKLVKSDHDQTISN